MKIEEYLQTLTGQIRYERARQPIEEEIRSHLEDQSEAYQLDGMSEEEAEEAAVLEMGDPVETGLSLDQIHRPKMPWSSIGFFMFLGLLGLAVQFLTVSVFYGEVNGTVNFGRQLVFLLIGFIVMAAVCYFDYGNLIRHAPRLYSCLYFILLFGGDTFGAEVNGVRRWIMLGSTGFGMDITLLVLLFIPLYAALLCQSRGGGYGTVLLNIGLMAMPLYLMFKIPSMAGMLVLAVSFSFLLSFYICKGGYRVAKKHALLMFWGPAAVMAAVLLMLQNKTYGITRIQRLFGLGEGISYTLETVRKILHGAVWIGEGSYAGEGILPFSDYMLVYLISKLGIAAGFAVILLAAGMLLYLYRKAFGQGNECGRMLGISCATAFLAQFIFYLLSNLGVISITGYCPFLSSGLTGTLMTYLMLGILLSVLRMDPVMALYGQKVPETKKNEKSKEDSVFLMVVVVVMCVVILVKAA